MLVCGDGGDSGEGEIEGGNLGCCRVEVVGGGGAWYVRACTRVKVYILKSQEMGMAGVKVGEVIRDR
jgi:hypothetical protein